ncbi:MAG: chitobiase/beta-hexosaminidase C-terminal domain-containing protein [Prevotella sp.]|nr:chitobiase/beta-hexosaminidase C-terminal domain-containing protein [Prevotella sp.]
MKKLFTLMTLLMLSVTTWAAVGDKYEIIFNGSNVVKLNGAEIAAEDYLTWNSAKHNFNAKFTGCTYAGNSFTKGLKMEGATLVQWTATAESKVIIVQSNWSKNTIKFDDEELDVASSAEIEGGMVYTLENIQAGTHTVKRGSGETGIFYISVEYTGEAKIQLDTPTFDVDPETGTVAINPVDNMKEIRYTTDGTNPGADAGEVYAAPFKVEDGTTVKAVAIGEGNFINSAMATTLVLVDGVTVKMPVIKQQNGTVYIKSETIGSTIEYSLDQATWKNGDRAFTLFESATVYARALREGSITSEVASEKILVNKAPTNTEKVYLFYDNPDNPTIWGYCNENTMEGQGGTAYYGYEMSISGNDTKNWSSADPVIVPGIQVPGMTFPGDSVTTLKLSNGAQNTISFEGKKAVRLTFYSYVNGAEAAATAATGWREVNGVEYDYAEVPMCCFNDLRREAEGVDEEGNPVIKEVKDMAGNADVRVYDLDFVEDKVTFTNKGTQICFVAVLDLATANTVVDHSATEGVYEMKAATAQKGETFNMAGQKVDAAFRGIVIRDGKKMIRK